MAGQSRIAQLRLMVSCRPRRRRPTSSSFTQTLSTPSLKRGGGGGGVTGRGTHLARPQTLMGRQRQAGL